MVPRPTVAAGRPAGETGGEGIIRLLCVVRRSYGEQVAVRHTDLQLADRYTTDGRRDLESASDMRITTQMDV